MSKLTHFIVLPWRGEKKKGLSFISLLHVFAGGHVAIAGQHEAHRERAGSGEAEEIHRGLWPGGLKVEPKQQGPGFVKS